MTNMYTLYPHLIIIFFFYDLCMKILHDKQMLIMDTGLSLKVYIF